MDQKSEDTRRMAAPLTDDNSHTLRRNQPEFAQLFAPSKLAASLLSYCLL
jgi:hypothetical protein